MNKLNDFSKVKVLVLGDVMLDRFWWGTVDRISPEAPVPVVKLNRATDVPGGAANVAANICGLGATATLVGVIGDDPESEILFESLRKLNVSPDDLIKIDGRSTTVKTRIIAHGQQVVRLDQETDADISQVAEEGIFEPLRDKIDACDVVLISDYAKGFLTAGLVQKVINYSRNSGKPVLIDPKGKDYSKYNGATLLTPNKREAADASGLEVHSAAIIDRAGEKLLSQLSLDALLITQGEDGMTLFESGKSPFHLKALAREVFDVTGAGDTVISTLAVALGAGATLSEASNMANVAARIVVGQIGTTSISISELNKALDDHTSQG